MTDQEIWTLTYEQQWLECSPCKSPQSRSCLNRFLDSLAQGIRSKDTSEVALRLPGAGRVLRKGYVRKDAESTVIALVLWTTDFAYRPDWDVYEETVQVLAVCSVDKAAEVASRWHSLWEKRSLRDVCRLRGLVAGPRARQTIRTGCHREWPRQLPCGKDLDMAWFSKFVHLHPDLRSQWLAGEDIAWDRLPIIGTEEQQRHVLAPGPLILVGRAGSGKTVVLRDRLWRHYAEAQALQMPRRQVFVTISPMLARSAAKQFAEAQQRYFPSATAVVFEENLNLHAGLDALPKAPCFLSFRTFAKLLSAWLGVGCFTEGQVEADFEGIAPVRPGKGKSVEVTYAGFREWFWTTHAPRWKERYSALVVWGEIQSFLKGHPLAREGPQGFALTRDQYAGEIGKRQAVGLKELHKDIFDIFKSYQAWCSEKGCFDRADLAQSILHRLRERQPTPWIDWLYIDEVQDLMLIEVDLCLRCLRDLSGASFGGDTTQTVSQGVSFRFCDLDTALQQEADRRAVVPPPAKHWAQLTVNHRSHAGLVEMSNFFARLLELLFPFTMESMAPARSSLNGPRPMVIGRSQSPILDLGADQVFLVNSSQVQLPPFCRGAVATPAQVKGMEYTDVVLLDWWSLTPNQSLWEKLLAIESAVQQCWRTGCDDAARHLHRTWQVPPCMPLSKELKQLFVAVTRAQQGLVIYEQKPGLASRVCDFLQRAGVLAPHSGALLADLDARSIGQRNAAAFQTRGDDYFRRGLYDLAAQMWERAGQEHENAGSFEEAREQYDRARCWESAARCTVQTGRPEAEQRALVGGYANASARLVTRLPQWVRQMLEPRQWWMEAAQAAAICGESRLQARYLVQAGQYEEAGKAFERASQWEDALQNYIRGGALWSALRLADRVPSVDRDVPKIFLASQKGDEQQAGEAMIEFQMQERQQTNGAPCTRAADVLRRLCTLNTDTTEARPKVRDIQTLVRLLRKEVDWSAPPCDITSSAEDLLPLCGATLPDLHLLRTLELLPQAAALSAAERASFREYGGGVVLPTAIAKDFRGTRPLLAWPTQLRVLGWQEFHDHLRQYFAPKVRDALLAFHLPDQWTKQHDASFEVSVWCAAHFGAEAVWPVVSRLAAAKDVPVSDGDANLERAIRVLHRCTRAPVFDEGRERQIADELAQMLNRWEFDVVESGPFEGVCYPEYKPAEPPDIRECRRQCAEHRCGAFVVWKGAVFFKTSTVEECECEARNEEQRVGKGGATTHLCKVERCRKLRAVLDEHAWDDATERFESSPDYGRLLEDLITARAPGWRRHLGPWIKEEADMHMIRTFLRLYCAQRQQLASCSSASATWSWPRS